MKPDDGSQPTSRSTNERVSNPAMSSHFVSSATPIALVGLRASGKSTLGAILARRLNRELIDLDVEIARLHASDRRLAARETMHAGEILRLVGEIEFRVLESRALLAALDRPEPCVIATGGGVVEYSAHRRWLRARAWTVWLQIPLEELARRLRNDPTPRPGLLGDDPIAEIERLAAHRNPLYRECAHFVLPGATLGPELLADAIIARLAGPGP